MKVNDIGKMVLLGMFIASITALRYVGAIDEAGYYGLAGIIVGYLVGNGVNALRGVPGSPALIGRDAQPALVVQPTGSSIVSQVEPDEG